MVSQLKESDYGRNILTTIQLEATSGTDESTVKRIVAMLNELLDQVNAELSDLTVERGRKKGECDGRIESLQNDIATLTVAIAERESSIPPIENLRDQKDADRKLKEDELNILRDDLRQIEEQNEEERQFYFQSRDDHDSLVAELNRAKAIIAELKKGAFLEKNSHETVLAQLANHATDALTRIKLSHQKTIFSFLMNMAQQVGVQADQDLVKKVINIIEELIQEEEYA